MFRKLLIIQFKSYMMSMFPDNSNRKRGKKKARARSIGATLLLYLFISIIFTGFVTLILAGTSMQVVGTRQESIIFMLPMALAVLMNVIGSAYTVSDQVYGAKDNHILIPMPIPVKTIVKSKLASLTLSVTLGSLIFMLGQLIAYVLGAFAKGVGSSTMIVSILLQVFMYVPTILFSVGLVMIFAYVISLFNLPPKFKNAISIVISMIFGILYFFICFRAQGIASSFEENSSRIFEALNGNWNLFFIGGEGISTVNVIYILIYSLVCIIPFVIGFRLMVSSYLKVSTRNVKFKKIKYSGNTAGAKSPIRTLYHVNMKRLTMSTMYFMTCCMGYLIFVLAAVALVIKQDAINNLVYMIAMGLNTDPSVGVDIIVLIFAMGTGYINSLSSQAASSGLSIEGQAFSILRSMPISEKELILSKLAFPLSLGVVPNLLLSTIVCIVMKPSLLIMMVMYLLPIAQVILYAIIGTYFGVKYPYFDWNTENQAFKNSKAAKVTTFLSLIIYVSMVIIVGIICGIVYTIDARAIMYVGYALTVLLIAIDVILYSFLKSSGRILLNKIDV